MIESMTGFGRGTSEADGITATVEIRSVNNRYLETSVRLPATLAGYEGDIQAMIRAELSRGKINATVQLSFTRQDALPMSVNEEAARAYGNLLETLRVAAGITAPVRLEDLLRFSEVLTADDTSSRAIERCLEVTKEATASAVANLKQMRQLEGRALQTDLEERISAIERELVDVEARAPLRIADARSKMIERLEQVITDDRIDRDRLEMEVAMFADRLDVTEECVRLRSHIEVFRNALMDENPAGRKLNFLLQEMNREVNTIGSKANDADIAHRAVSMKEELEKIREQVQNIE